MIAGGGTGGHAIPALCVADSLRAKGAVVEFVGATSGIEMDLVPQKGYVLHSLPLKGLDGGLGARVRAVALFVQAVISRCRRIIQEFRPSVVLGVGGYASAPAVLAAHTLGVPTVLHEQNSVPGRVNRFASRLTQKILVTFPAAVEHFTRAVWVGMPTRREFFEASREEALRELGLEPPVVLIFGGSGGALKINLDAQQAFREATPYTVVQVAGRRDFPSLQTENNRHIILEYADDLWRYVAAAEVVITRAGAGSLFDVAAVGRASVLIPFPHATGNHQLHNARYFTERGAAELLPNSEVTSEVLRHRVEDLLEDSERRERLAGSMKELATPGAADEVARRLLNVTVEGREDTT
ncbi:MAG: undecaprenyldiphospho-muramoylpentapeptide beta-N-acetylglucosaminyltransferase [Rubrobacter sp.]|nr:undecaprenyldiphospho-muramoylpentapeptide beta-N-acetylglucosaminyltransferase [Rubrobacter sp.]